MSLRLSPTLELAQRVAEARAAGQEAWSLSTPSLLAPPELPEPRADWLKLTPPQGLPALRSAARAAFFDRWPAPEHACIITAGAKAAIFTVLRAALPAGSGVIVPCPAWPSYVDLCAAANVTPLPLPGKHPDFALDRAALEDLAPQAQAVLLANPCNPTGRILAPDEMALLAEISARHGLLLIVDQSFSAITFDHGAWGASVLPASDRLVVIDSFSKNYLLQGARVAAALVPPALTEPIVAMHQTLISAAPSPGQYLALHALETAAVMPDLSAQRALARDFIDAQGWEVFPQQGSFYFFPKLPEIGAFEAKARSRGVHLLSGSAFGAPYGDHFRLCFGRPMAELEVILQRLTDL